jgi:hypothetical protein
MMTQATGLCEGCHELKSIAYTDPVGREYCPTCLPNPTPFRLLAFLLATIPFQIGDRVECRTAGVLYDGIGVIDDISVEPHNFGTPVYPSFHVRIEEPAYPEAPKELWYMEAQLRLVERPGEGDDMSIKKYSSESQPEEPIRGDEDDDEASQATHEPLDKPGDEWNDTPNLPEL